MLEGRYPVAQFGSDRFKIPRTAQLFGTEALGHPALHLRDVTKLCSFDEDAFGAQALEFPGRFRTSGRVQRWSRHTERLSTPKSHSRAPALLLCQERLGDDAIGLRRAVHAQKHQGGS